MWSRILGATDCSETAHHAGRTALTVANWSGAEIDVVTVIPAAEGDLPPALLSIMNPDELANAERQMASEVEAEVLEQLRAEADFLFAAGREVPLHVRSGIAPVEIVAQAGEVSADLIVLGATGQRDPREVVFGSTVDNVARHASCPVLVVR